MSFLWDSLKNVGQKGADAAVLAGKKTKLHADVMLLDREMASRKQSFGVELYDYIAPLAAKSDFFAASDKMTETIRGPFLRAQREIAALGNSRRLLKERIAQAEVTRKAAFPTPAETIAQKVLNATKATGYAGIDAKLRTELTMLDTRIRGIKQEFGVEFYDVLVQLEDGEGWLPTVRDIRTMYDQVRRDLEKIEFKKADKKKELKELGGGSSDDAEAAVVPVKAVLQANASEPCNGLRDDSYNAPAAEAIAVSSYAVSAGAGSFAPQPQAHRTFGVDPFGGSVGGYLAPAVPLQAPTTAVQHEPFAMPYAAGQQQQQPQPASYDPFGGAQPVTATAFVDPFGAAPAPTAPFDPFAGL
jgi:hypothetical protein